ncbi:hypothetical protein B0I27_11541 [Arcticibacter pallidicorallinus]|uniref:Acetoacetate decarboxylase n=1 Tax=Arcticibacter pallidicorallinus TaxID=1259464 RepID=A0A2T0TRU4_9SPHI|nr:DUF2071 domain-containing protein [Arcticibacter pallidicorallinus]PRY48340.1 hypothetical protein B0I27_11541 [Arcticibacter pallidicorallinus]
MTHKQILGAPNHRQFPKPHTPWLMYQEWYGVVFLHIPVYTDIVIPLIPKGTVPDLYNGQAWISVLAFTVRNAHPRIAPPLPYLSNFHEINLRTYVRFARNDRPGITFLDINASKSLPSFLGRAYGLPYRHADIYRYERSAQLKIISQKAEGCSMNLDITTSAITHTKSPLDVWLTERFIAYQQLRDGIYSYPIQHKEWQLKPMTMDGSLQYNFKGLELSYKDVQLAHYADNMQVLLWNRMHNHYLK